MSKRNERNSSVELLRIIAMFLILFSHFAIHGNFNFDQYEITIPRFWWYFIQIGGDMANNIFIIISGYYLSTSKKYQELNQYLKRILKFVGQVVFYSLVIYLLFVCFGKIEFSLSALIKNVLPLASEQWLFASTYIVLYILHPFINKFISSINKQSYLKLLLILLTLWCLIPTFTKLNYSYSYLLWFITMYLVAGYYKIYGINKSIYRKKCLAIFIVAALLNYLSAIVLMLFGTKIIYFASRTQYFFSINSIFTFISAIMLFAYFEKTTIKYNKLINTVSAATFGVYLIHDNDYTRSFLWEEIFKNNQFQKSLFLIPYSIICVTAVFVVCVIVDIIRKRTVEKLYMSFVEDNVHKISESLVSIYHLFQNKIL